MANYSINNLPADLPDLFNSNSDPDLNTIFDNSKKRTLYFYPIHSLYKDNDTNTINFAPNIVRIGFLDIDEQKQVTAFEITNFKSQLKAVNLTDGSDNTITQFNYIDQKQLITQDLDLLNQFKLYAISINSPVTEDTINNLYLLNYYEQPYQGDETICTKTITITKIKDFTTNEGNPLIIKLQKPLAKDTKLTSIKIKAPKGALFGNIKIKGEINGMEVYPKITIQNDKIAFPLFALPIETEPKVRILQQWFSEQILPWNLAKQFLEPNSILPLIKIEAGTETIKKIIPRARVTNFWMGRSNLSWPDYVTWPLKDIVEIKDKEISSIITRDSTTGQQMIHSTATTDKYLDVEVEIENAPNIDSLGKLLIEFLNYTYNYNRNFEGASFNSSKPNEIDKLRAKFEGQKPELVVTNLFNQWKLDYPNYINNSKLQTFKQIVLMLSKSIISTLSINKGLNDDNKILLPYYFELISKPTQRGEDNPWEFKDVEVILKSEYFNFHNLNNVEIKNNEVSQNLLFKLDDNQFNWPPISSQLQSNKIPSLLPSDISLSNAEYGKYFVKSFINKNKIENLLALFGSNRSDLYSKYSWYKEILTIDSGDEFELLLENPVSKLKHIEIGCIFGHGKYNLTFLTNQNEEVNLTSIDLFSNGNDKISYSTLEF